MEKKQVLIIALLVVAILFSIASILLNLELRNAGTTAKPTATTGHAVTSGKGYGKVQIEIKPPGSGGK